MGDWKDWMRDTADRLATISVPAGRALRLAERLNGMSVAECADLLDVLYFDACRHWSPALFLLDLLANRDFWRRHTPAERVQALLVHADAEDMTVVMHLVAPPAPERAYRPLEPHKDLSGLPLGVRKSMAKSADATTLEKLMVDPHPQVIGILLDNPRLRLKGLLYIVTRRPNDAAVLETVHRHPRWGLKYEVKRALASNPFAPLDIVTLCVPWLLFPDLHLLAYGESPAVRLMRRVLEWRRATGEGLRPLKPHDPGEVGTQAEGTLAELLADGRVEVTAAELDETTLAIEGRHRRTADEAPDDDSEGTGGGGDPPPKPPWPGTLH